MATLWGMSTSRDADRGSNLYVRLLILPVLFLFCFAQPAVFGQTAEGEGEGEGELVCPVLPVFDGEGGSLAPLFGEAWETVDLEGNMIADSWEMAVLAHVLCDDPSHPLHAETVAVYLYNLNEVELAAYASGQSFFYDIWGHLIAGEVSLNAQFQANWQGILAGGAFMLVSGNPFDAFSDLDGDGLLNIDEYNVVVGGGGTREDFVTCAVDPGCPTEGTPSISVTDSDAVPEDHSLSLQTCPGTFRLETFTIANTGDSLLTISDIYSITGSPVFFYEGLGAVDLNPGQQHVVEVVFSPPAEDVYTDELMVLSNDAASPQTTLSVNGQGAHTCYVYCPVIVNVDNEGDNLLAGFGIDYFAMDGNADGVLDSWQFYLLNEALCNAANDWHLPAQCAYSSNMVMLDHEGGGWEWMYAAYLSAAMALDPSMQAWTAMSFGLFRPYSTAAGDPFGADSDPDGDGVNNRDEFVNVIGLLGNCDGGREFYAMCAFDPALDGSYIPPAEMEVTGPNPMTVCPLDFGYNEIVLTNVSDSLLVINDIYSVYDVQQGPGNPFTYQFPQSLPIVLGPGEPYTVQLEFSPPAEGSFSDTVVVLSNDSDTPVVQVPVSGTGDYAACAEVACPILPVFDAEGQEFIELVWSGIYDWETNDIYDHDGITDNWTVAVLAEILCDPAQPHYYPALSAFTHNFHLWETIYGASWANAIGAYNSVSAHMREEMEDFAAAFGSSFMPIPGEPLAADADADADGWTNYEEYVGVRCAGESRATYVDYVLDPSMTGGWYEGTHLSVSDSDGVVYDRSVDLIGCPGETPLQSFVLQNAGSTMLTINAIYSAYDYYSMPGSPFSYVGLADVPVVLAPGQVRVVDVSLDADTSGVWSDTVSILSDDEIQPYQELSVWAIADEGLCCPVTPLIVDEYDFAVMNVFGTVDLDYNGILDPYEGMPVMEILCDPAHPLYEATRRVYAHNLAEAFRVLSGTWLCGQVEHAVAGMAMISPEMQDYMAMFFGGEYGLVEGSPYEDRHDIDGDGLSNETEWYNVVSWMGIDTYGSYAWYLRCVLDPALDGSPMAENSLEVVDRDLYKLVRSAEITACPYNSATARLALLNVGATVLTIDSIYSMYDMYTGPGNPFSYNQLAAPVQLWPAEERSAYITYTAPDDGGTYTDEYVFVSDDTDEPVISVSLTGSSDFSECPTVECPIMPVFDLEGVELYMLASGDDWYTHDSDENGLADHWEASLLAAILCDPAHPRHASAVVAYLHNLEEFRNACYTCGVHAFYDNWGHVFAAMLTVNTEAHDLAHDIACGFGDYMLPAGDPFDTYGDVDGDGVSNYDEYANVLCAGGTAEDYAVAASDPTTDGSTLPGTHLGVVDPDAPVWDRSFEFIACPSNTLVKDLVIRNAGTTLLTIDAIYTAYDYYGIPDGPFSYTGLLDVPVVLAPGEEHLIQSEFTSAEQGVFEDEIYVLSDDENAPLQAVQVWAMSDIGFCCPVLAHVGDEGDLLFETFGEDIDGNGIFDLFELMPPISVLCDETHPLYGATRHAYAHNLAEVRRVVQGLPFERQLDHGLAVMALTSPSLRDFVHMLTSCAGTFLSVPGEPYAPDGNPDSDAFVNFDEYWNVVSTFGLDDHGAAYYARCVFDPALDGLLEPVGNLEVVDRDLVELVRSAELVACPLNDERRALKLMNVGATEIALDAIYSAFDLYVGGDNPFSFEVDEGLPTVLYPAEARRFSVYFHDPGDGEIHFDQLLIESTDPDEPMMTFDLAGYADYEACEPVECPIMPIFDDEGWPLYGAMWGQDWMTADENQDGMVDRWQVAMLADALCDEAHPAHDETLAAYLSNLGEIERADYESGQEFVYYAFGRVLAALATIDVGFHDAIRELLAGLGDYVLPAGEPFRAENDADGDGVSNYDEYVNILCAGGTMEDFVDCVNDPTLDGTQLPGTVLAVYDSDSPAYDRHVGSYICTTDAASYSFVLQNAGDTLLQIAAIDSIYYPGGAGSPFTYTGLGGPLALLPGETHLVDVEFAPAAAGDYFDSLIVLSDDANEPEIVLNISSVADDGLCCPILPVIDSEGPLMFGGWDVEDMDANGMIDSWEIAVLATVLCDPAHPSNFDALQAYGHNLAVSRQVLSDAGFGGIFDHAYAAYATVSPGLRDFIAGILGGDYAGVPGEPFSAFSDADADGASNWDEYFAVVSQGGSRADYVACALNPGCSFDPCDYNDDFSDSISSLANFRPGFWAEQPEIWSVVPEPGYVSNRLYDFDTPDTGLGDRGVVSSPGFDIADMGGNNVLANSVAAGSIYFELGMDAVSFDAVAPGALTVNAYDASDALLDSVSLSAPAFEPVSFTGPGIVCLELVADAAGAAVDNLWLDFASHYVAETPGNGVLIGDEAPFPKDTAMGLLNGGAVYLPGDLTLSFDTKLLGPDYSVYSNLRPSGAYWLTLAMPPADPANPLYAPMAGVAFTLEPGGSLVLWRGDAGAWNPVAETVLPPDFNWLAWRHFDVMQTGNIATVVMDGTWSVSADVGPLPAGGHVGLYNSESAAYDNIVLDGDCAAGTGDADGDGIMDSEDGNTDPDYDGLPNCLDADSDNDGIPDMDEGVWDADYDGIPNYCDTDSDGDGIPDADEGTDDTDGDWIPNYLDLDSDGDGIPDADEGAGDPDADGLPNYLDLDSDGDNVLDRVEVALGYDPYDPASECWTTYAAQAETIDFDAILAVCYDWPYDGSYPLRVYATLDADCTMNTVPDADEFALLAEILHNPALPYHDMLHDAFTANVLATMVDLTPEMEMFLPELKWWLAALATIAGDNSWNWYCEMVSAVRDELGSPYYPNSAHYQLLPEFAACGDLDLDGVANINEFNGQGRSRATYLSAVLDPAQVADGGDSWGVCSGQYGGEKIYWYNPDNQHVYRITPAPMYWHDAEMFAENNWIGAAFIPGTLATINSAQEEYWVAGTFMTLPYLWLGFNDETVEGAWEWLSGEPVTYTNWAPGEPVDFLGDEDYCRYERQLQAWQAYPPYNASRGVIEFPGEYSDLDLDGIPDAWEDNNYNGTPDGFESGGELIDFAAIRTTLATWEYEGFFPLAPDATEDADNNGNGMADAAECALLAEILANPSLPMHTVVRDAYDANVAQIQLDLAPDVELLLPDWKYFLAAYATFGDDASWTYMAWWVEDQGTLSARAAYAGLPDLLSACGDLDGDGVVNLGEYYAWGADPLLYVPAALEPAVLDDGGDPFGTCIPPDSFFDVYYHLPLNGHVYRLTPVPMTWDDAELYAENHSFAGIPIPGTLAAINDPAENAWIFRTFSVSINEPFWIGFKETATEGVYEWITGEPVVHTNWQGGEPNNLGGLENRVEMYPTGRWNDNDNPSLKLALVELAGTYTDTDGDGVPEEWEDNNGNGVPDGFESADTDGDGIPDNVEGTGDPDGDGIPNYLDLDSDGDGVSDQIEAALGYDPYDPASECLSLYSAEAAALDFDAILAALQAFEWMGYYPFFAHGLPDADVNRNTMADNAEFALLQSILSEPTAPNHAEVLEAFTLNALQAMVDMPLPGDSLLPEAKWWLSAFATFGDDKSWWWFSMIIRDVNVELGEPAYYPDRARYLTAAVVSACGDPDGDGVANINEYNGQGADRTAFVAAALDAGAMLDGGDSWGVCEGQYGGPKEYYYNPANGNVYRVTFPDDWVTWVEAQTYAENHSIGSLPLPGNLVTVRSADENGWLMTNFVVPVDTNCWIGFNDEAQEGSWVWASGEPVVYTNWNSGEPNNANNDEHYAELLVDYGTWNDRSAAFVHPGIIEFTGPFPDADGDGVPEQWDDVNANNVPDGFESQDSDGDGIPDYVEGDGDPDGDGIPNFLDLDSDGDGVNDADEAPGDADGDGIPNYLDSDPSVFGTGYRTGIYADGREFPVVVVSGTPYEMGYHYGQLMSGEINAFVPSFLALIHGSFTDAELDAAWAATESYTDPRYEEEMHGLAVGAGISFLDIRRIHCAVILDSYSCSSVAAWGIATADGHLLQTRDLDWSIEAMAHEFPAIVMYMPDSGRPHLNIAFAGLVGSHTGMNDRGIVLSEMGDSPSSEMPYDLDGTHFMPMFRNILYDANNLTDALNILTNAQRIKRYHYVFGDGQTELQAAKIKAHAPELPPDDLVVWFDNDPTDEFAPDVAEDVVYNDEGRGAFPMIMADYGALDAAKLINIANTIAMSGNVVNVVYDATSLDFWVSYASGWTRAAELPYAAGSMRGFDGDGDGICDLDEGAGDPDGDGQPNYLDSDSDADGIPDMVEGDGDPDVDGVPNYLDDDSDGDGLPDAEEGAGDADVDGIPNFLDLDSDSDGLADADEAFWLTSPINGDSDGDGLLDGAEVYTHGTDPAVVDTDGDGLSDGYEVYFAAVETIDFEAVWDGVAAFLFDGSYPFAGYVVPGADNNSNTMPDEAEFALLAAILADPALPCHDAVHAAYTANILRVLEDMAVIACQDAWVPSYKFFVAAYATFGDDASWAFVEYQSLDVTSEMGAPYCANRADYVQVPGCLSACGDADGDGVANVNEYNGQGGDQAAFVTAALDAGIAVDGGDSWGVCSGQFGGPKAYYYNPANGNVYCLTPGDMTWPDAQAWAEAHAIGGAPLPGNLATIRSADENQWLVNTFSINGKCWMGFNDIAVEDDWVWVSGEPVVYTNWDAGEPNDDDGEDFGEIYVDGFWNDNGITRVGPGIVEFVGPYPDNDNDGIPDAWEDNDASGTPDGFEPEYIDFAAIRNAIANFYYEGCYATEPDGDEAADNNWNTMTDAAEFALLAEVLADPGEPMHAAVRAAYDANVERVREDLVPEAEILLPEWKYFLAAYATFGDDLSWTYAAWWVEDTGVSPFRGDYQALPDALSACGDFDGDGVSNLAEYYGQGGDPTLYTAAAMDAGETTDGGDPDHVCTPPDSFFDVFFFNQANGHVYRLTPSAMSWEEAELYAEAHSIAGVPVPGTLTAVNSATENAWLFRTFLSPALRDNLWIGLRETAVEGVYEWVTGEPLVYENWQGCEPNNQNEDEDRAEMYGTGRWNDTHSPGYPRFAIVELPGVYTDTDADGIPEEWEDPDGDGIPNLADTDADGDGILDADEGSDDPDGDGIPNYLDTDSDGDGIPDADEGTDDPDGDGVPNYLDLDSDGDGLADADEGAGDPDGDWLPNYLDLDSDDDGVSDQAEVALGYDPYDPASECLSLYEAEAATIDYDEVFEAMRLFSWPGDFPFAIYTTLNADLNKNTMADIDEFALLTAIIANPALPESEAVRTALAACAIQAQVDMGALPDTALPELKWYAAAFAVFGDDNSWLRVDHAIHTATDHYYGYQTQPNRVLYPAVPVTSACGDLDADSVANINEYNGQGGDRAMFVAAALDPVTMADGGDSWGVCTGQYGGPKTFYYNSANGNVYCLIPPGLTWPESQAWAEAHAIGGAALPGDLATIRSAAENQWLARTFSVFGKCWMGFNDVAAEGNWVWVSGEPVVYTNWASIEPNGGYGENFGEIYSDGTWNDIGISRVGPGIAEFVGPYPDQDGDGAPDGWEDSDSDGVPDFLDGDTDGDGIPDGVEGEDDPDGDGLPNFLDDDSDGDGILDSDEGTGDPDSDGIPNYLDTDADGDAIPDSVEGAGDPDADGVPNYLDDDSDGDSIPDITEGTGDADFDGIPNYLDLDSDTDGLSDADEILWTADPYDGDTDNDGLLDGDEVIHYGTHPVDPDSDDDGLSDGYEVYYAAVETIDFEAVWDGVAAFLYYEGYPFASYVIPGADNNSNTVPDEAEFALLAAILANPALPCHDAVHAAYTENVLQGLEDMAVIACQDAWVPSYKFFVAAYATFGDDASWAFVEYQSLDVTSEMGAPYCADRADYVQVPGCLSACGDADGDGVANISEYNGQGGGQAAFVTAALDAGIAVDGGDSWGVCSGQYGTSKTYFYNPANGKVYRFTPDRISWNDAEAYAQAYMFGSQPVPAHLATVRDEAENEWLRRAFPLGWCGNAWIGFNDIAVEGDWVWVSGEPVTYINWRDGEPNNSNGVEHYGELRKDGLWNDENATCLRYGIVEFPDVYPDANGDRVPDGWEDNNGNNLPDALEPPDSDDDGIPDADEGTGDPDGDGIPNYLDLDSDGDGLLDADEGTGDPDGDWLPNYLDLDSDGDNVADQAEVALGYDPYDAASECWSLYYAEAEAVDYDAVFEAMTLFEWEGDYPYAVYATPTADLNLNTIPDVVECALVGAIIAEPAHPDRDVVLAALTTSVIQARADLGVAPDSLLPELKWYTTAFAVFGDDISWEWMDEGIYSVTGDFGYPTHPVRSWYLAAPVTSACGDADGDSVANINEYNGHGKDRAAYLAAALDPGAVADGGDSWGVCTGQYGMPKTYFYNPDNGHVYRLTPDSMTWGDAQAYAQTHTIGAVAVPGNLVTIRSEAENTWLHDRFVLVNHACWIGFNDLAVEGVWEWVSGEPVTYTNWAPGEPNNGFGDENSCEFRRDTLWNDNEDYNMRHGIVEFAGHYPDLDGNGVPDAWEDPDENGTPEGLLDNTPPVITILGDNPALVALGDVYADAGATASDDVDGDITARIDTVSTVDTNVSGTYTVTYTVSDIAANVATEVRTVYVNAPPEAFGQKTLSPEDAPLALDPAYTDVDGPGPYTFAVVSGPAHGTAQETGATITYTPDENFFGRDTFTWAVHDGLHWSNEATATVVVVSSNDPPVSVEDAYVVNPGGTIDVPVAGVLANDADPEGNMMSAALVSGPAHGVLDLRANGSFTYTHGGGPDAADGFVYEASDGLGVGTPVAVNIVVTTTAAAIGSSDITVGSNVFTGPSTWVNIAAGEASNDSNADLVVTRGQDGGSGQMALFQRTAGGVWNAGNVVLTAGDGIFEPTLGVLKHNAARWIAYLEHDAAGGQIKASRLAGINLMETNLLGDAPTGKALPVFADIDGDSKIELYATVETATTAVLMKYWYGVGGYHSASLFDTGAAEVTWSAPVVGDFLNIGAESLAYDYGLDTLHAASYLSGAYQSDPMFADPVEPQGVRAAGNIDGVAGDDIVMARDTAGEVVLISGGAFGVSVIASGLTETVTALTCADLDGDGYDEVYGGGSGGSIFRYRPADGWLPVETVEGVVWHDATTAAFTGDPLEEAVFVGLDADGRLVIKSYGADTDEDGVTDNAEARYGTNPTLPDSDSDGVDDGDEVSVGADPADGNSTPVLFSGLPWEYTFTLAAGTITVADTVPGRDGSQTLNGAAAVQFGGGPVYTAILAGTDNADTLIGGSANEIVLGFGGGDYLRGYGGDDLIVGGGDGDTLLGDTGNDILLGEPGNDNCYAGSGDDFAFGGEGNDLVILGDDGSTDHVDGGDGGETSGDKLFMPVHSYPAFSMVGCNGFESFEGGTGHDYIDWSDATAVVSLRGNGGDDVLIGGSGSDLLFTGAGHDTCLGGGGNDLVTLTDADSETDIFEGGDGPADRLLLGVGYGTFVMTGACGFEEFIGTSEVDIVDWSSATVRVCMRGNGGADMLLAGSGDSDLVTLGGATHGGEVVSGGDGLNDTLLIDNGYATFTLTGACGFENFTGGDGDDTVDWSDAPQPVTLRGNDGQDTLTGGAFNDLLTGGGGDDALYGGGGADVLYGEGGINHLTGGDGNDSLRGGGSDYAHYSDSPVPPRYDVRDAGSYIVVTDITGPDGVDIVRGCPLANITGPYVP